MSKAQSLITSWLQGRAHLDGNGHLAFLPYPARAPLEKLRTAYDWISQHAIDCPYHDISFGGSTALGRDGQRVELPGGQSYASFLLLPILTKTERRKPRGFSPGGQKGLDISIPLFHLKLSGLGVVFHSISDFVAS